MIRSTRIKILLADDSELFRKGLAAQFETMPEFEIVGQVSDGNELLQKVSDLNPNLVITEVLLPILDGIAACRRLKITHPAIEVLFLSNLHTEDRIREAFERGARGYLLKSCSFEELAYAATKAAAGDYYLTGPIGADMVAEFVKPRLANQRPGGIMTAREKELARLLSDGYSTKEAADILNISPRTVETHRSSIMKKLNARNVTDIVKYCIRNHLIEP